MTTGEVDERAALLAVIAWKNELLTERDRVKAAIDAATDRAGVDDAVNGHALIATPFPL